MLTKRVRTISQAAVCSVAAATLLAACSSGSSDSSGPDKGSSSLKGKTVTYVSAATNSFTQCIGDALKEKVEASGARFVSLGSNFAPAQQQRNIQDAITSGTSAVALLGISSQLDTGAVKALAKAKIPLVYLVNLVPEGAKPPASIVVDTHGVTLSTVEALSDKLPGLTKVAYVDGIPGVPTNDAFVAGVEDGIKKLGGDYKIVGHVPGMYSETVVPQAAQQLLQKNPDVQVIVFNGSAGVAGAARILKAAHREDIKIVVIGAITKADYAAIKDGTWAYASAEAAPSIGTDAGTAIENLIAGKPGSQKSLPAVLIDKDNLEKAPLACK